MTLRFNKIYTNKELQSIQTESGLLSSTEFQNKTKTAFPLLWYQFDNSSLLKNYGKAYGYDKNIDITIDNEKKIGSSTNEIILNNKIVEDIAFKNTYTISFQEKHTNNGKIFTISNSDNDNPLIDLEIVNDKLQIITGFNSNLVEINNNQWNHIVCQFEQNFDLFIDNTNILSYPLSYIQNNIYSFNITDTGSYHIIGIDINSNINDDNVDIFLFEGDILEFNINTSGKPLNIQTYDTIWNNETVNITSGNNQIGTIEWIIQEGYSEKEVRYYYDDNYKGKINILKKQYYFTDNTSNIISLGANHEYKDLRIFDEKIEDINILYNIHNISKQFIGDLVNPNSHHTGKNISNSTNISINPFTYNDSFTICYWIKKEVRDSSNHITINTTDFYIYESNGILFVILQCIPVKTFYIKSNKTLINNKWNFIAITVNNNQLQLYVDNFPMVGMTFDGILRVYGTNNDIRVNSPSGTYIEDVRFYHNGLKYEEILDIFIGNEKLYNELNQDIIGLYEEWYKHNNDLNTEVINKYNYNVFKDDEIVNTGDFITYSQYPFYNFPKYKDEDNDLIFWLKFLEDPIQGNIIKDYAYGSNLSIHNNFVSNPYLIYNFTEDTLTTNIITNNGYYSNLDATLINNDFIKAYRWKLDNDNTYIENGSSNLTRINQQLKLNATTYTTDNPKYGTHCLRITNIGSLDYAQMKIYVDDLSEWTIMFWLKTRNPLEAYQFEFTLMNEINQALFDPRRENETDVLYDQTDTYSFTTNGNTFRNNYYNNLDIWRHWVITHESDTKLRVYVDSDLIAIRDNNFDRYNDYIHLRLGRAGTFFKPTNDFDDIRFIEGVTSIDDMNIHRNDQFNFGISTYPISREIGHIGSTYSYKINDINAYIQLEKEVINPIINNINFVISFWIKLDTLDDTKQILILSEDNTNNYLQIYFNNQNLNFNFIDTYTTTWNNIIIDNSWNNIKFTTLYKNPNLSTTLHLNNILISPDIGESFTDSSLLISPITSNSYATIGSNSLNFSIEDFKISDNNDNIYAIHKINNSYYWNGDTMNINDNSYLSGYIDKLENTFSISFWKKLDQINIIDETFVIKDKIRISLCDALSNTVSYSLSNSTINLPYYADTDWHFWSFQYDGTKSIIYKDSRLIATENITDIQFTNNELLYIGGSNNYDMSPSYIHDFRIHNKALLYYEILDIMNSFNGYKGHLNDLKYWYKFDINPITNNSLINYSYDVDIYDAYIINAKLAPGGNYPLIDLENYTDMILWLKFDTIGFSNDSSGNAYGPILNTNGVIINQSDYIRGDASAEFRSGDNSYIITSNDGAFAPNSDFSVCVWVKTSEQLNVKGIASCRELSETQGGWTLMIYGKYLRILTFSDENDVTPDNTGNIGNIDIANGEWTHITFMIDYPHQLLSVYINGVLRYSVIVEYNGMNTDKLFIGCIDFSNFLGINDESGFMDDFRMYRSILSEYQIKKIMGYTLTRQLGIYSPYSYYWNGVIDDQTDNAYLSIDITELNEFTICFWYKKEDIGKENTLFYISNDVNELVETHISSNIYFHFGSNILQINDYIDNNYHHLAFTYDTSNISIYKDGISRNSLLLTNFDSNLDISTANKMYIGGKPNILNDISSSYLEDFRMYNKVLNSIEIIEIMDPIQGRNDNMSIWYRFIENPNDIIYNYALNNYDAYINSNITKETGFKSKNSYLINEDTYLNIDINDVITNIIGNNNTYSVSFWYKSILSNNINSIISFMDNDIYRIKVLLYTQNNNIHIKVIFNELITYSGNINVDITKWNRYSIIYDNNQTSVADKCRIFIVSNNITWNQIILNNDGVFNGFTNENITNIKIGNSGHFYLEDFRIYQIALHQTDVINLTGYDIDYNINRINLDQYDENDTLGRYGQITYKLPSFTIKKREDDFIGYNNHINDLIVWLQFNEQDEIIENKGYDKKIYGIKYGNLIRKNGYLNHRSYEWINGSYIDLLKIHSITKESILSFNFWIKLENSVVKNTVFSLGNKNNDILTFGFKDNDKVFLEINDNEIIYLHEAVDGWNHWSIEFEIGTNTITFLRLRHSIKSTKMIIKQYDSDYNTELVINDWNHISILRIGDKFVGSDSLYPYSLEDFRVYNKSIETFDYLKLFNVDYDKSEFIVPLDNDKDLNITFYNTDASGLLKNVGSGGSELDIGIVNNGNIAVIDNSTVKDENTLKQKYQFYYQWQHNIITNDIEIIDIKSNWDLNSFSFNINIKRDNIAIYDIININYGIDKLIVKYNNGTKNLIIDFYRYNKAFYKEINVTGKKHIDISIQQTILTTDNSGNGVSKNTYQINNVEYEYVLYSSGHTSVISYSPTNLITEYPLEIDALIVGGGGGGGDGTTGYGGGGGGQVLLQRINYIGGNISITIGSGGGIGGNGGNSILNYGSDYTATGGYGSVYEDGGNSGNGNSGGTGDTINFSGGGGGGSSTVGGDGGVAYTGISGTALIYDYVGTNVEYSIGGVGGTQFQISPPISMFRCKLDEVVDGPLTTTGKLGSVYAEGFTINNTGTYMYVCEFFNNIIRQISLTYPYECKTIHGTIGSSGDTINLCHSPKYPTTHDGDDTILYFYDSTYGIKKITFDEDGTITKETIVQEGTATNGNYDTARVSNPYDLTYINNYLFYREGLYVYRVSLGIDKNDSNYVKRNKIGYSMTGLTHIQFYNETTFYACISETSNSRIIQITCSLDFTYVSTFIDHNVSTYYLKDNTDNSTYKFRNYGHNLYYLKAFFRKDTILYYADKRSDNSQIDIYSYDTTINPSSGEPRSHIHTMNSAHNGVATNGLFIVDHMYIYGRTSADSQNDYFFIYKFFSTITYPIDKYTLDSVPNTQYGSGGHGGLNNEPGESGIGGAIILRYQKYTNVLDYNNYTIDDITIDNKFDLVSDIEVYNKIIQDNNISYDLIINNSIEKYYDIIKIVKENYVFHIIHKHNDGGNDYITVIYKNENINLEKEFIRIHSINTVLSYKFQVYKDIITDSLENNDSTSLYKINGFDSTDSITPQLMVWYQFDNLKYLRNYGDTSKNTHAIVYNECNIIINMNQNQFSSVIGKDGSFDSNVREINDYTISIDNNSYVFNNEIQNTYITVSDVNNILTNEIMISFWLNTSNIKNMSLFEFTANIEVKIEDDLLTYKLFDNKIQTNLLPNSENNYIFTYDHTKYKIFINGELSVDGNDTTDYNFDFPFILHNIYPYSIKDFRIYNVYDEDIIKRISNNYSVLMDDKSYLEINSSKFKDFIFDKDRGNITINYDLDIYNKNKKYPILYYSLDNNNFLSITHENNIIEVNYMREDVIIEETFSNINGSSNFEFTFTESKIITSLPKLDNNLIIWHPFNDLKNYGNSNIYDKLEKKGGNLIDKFVKLENKKEYIHKFEVGSNLISFTSNTDCDVLLIAGGGDGGEGDYSGGGGGGEVKYLYNIEFTKDIEYNFIVGSSNNDTLLYNKTNDILIDKVLRGGKGGSDGKEYKYTNGIANSNSPNIFSYRGEYVMINIGEQFVLKEVKFYPQNNFLERAPGKFKIYGTNDINNFNNSTFSSGWTEIYEQTERLSGYVYQEAKTVSITNEHSYSIYLLIINELSGNGEYANFVEWELYGDDLINNSQNQITFSEIRKYPPTALTGGTINNFSITKTPTQPYTYGGGDYILTWSCQVNSSQSGDLTLNAAVDHPEIGWISDLKYDTSTGYSTATTSYIGTDSNNHGAFIKIQLPVSIILSSVDIYGRNYASFRSRDPKRYVVYGSNDGVNWTILIDKTEADVSYEGYKTSASVSTTDAYSYYAFTFTKVGTSSSGYLGIAEIEIFGQEELIELIKFPKNPFTLSDEGVKVKASSIYSTDFKPYHIFNHIIDDTVVGYSPFNFKYQPTTTGSAGGPTGYLPLDDIFTGFNGSYYKKNIYVNSSGNSINNTSGGGGGGATSSGNNDIGGSGLIFNGIEYSKGGNGSTGGGFSSYNGVNYGDGGSGKGGLGQNGVMYLIQKDIDNINPDCNINLDEIIEYTDINYKNSLKVHQYNTFNYIEFTENCNILHNLNETLCDILVIGKGGDGGLGGSTQPSGGGGAGELIYLQNITFTKNTIYRFHIHNDYSEIFDITNNTSIYKALSGGVGGGSISGIPTSGGSGGGGGFQANNGYHADGDTNATGYVNDGVDYYTGTGPGGIPAGGGGGGSSTNGIGYVGGDGMIINFTGTEIEYAKGGNGSYDNDNYTPINGNTYGSGGSGQAGLGANGYIAIRWNNNKNNKEGYTIPYSYLFDTTSFAIRNTLKPYLHYEFNIDPTTNKYIYNKANEYSLHGFIRNDNTTISLSDNSFYFDTLTDYIELPIESIQPILNHTKFSIYYQIKQNNQNNGIYDIFSIKRENSQYYIKISYSNTNLQLNVYDHNNSDTVRVLNTNLSSFDLTTWYNVLFTFHYNLDEIRIELFINGIFNNGTTLTSISNFGFHEITSTSDIILKTNDSYIRNFKLYDGIVSQVFDNYVTTSENPNSYIITDNKYSLNASITSLSDLNNGFIISYWLFENDTFNKDIINLSPIIIKHIDNNIIFTIDNLEFITPILSRNRWNHYIFAFDNSKNSHIYINGVQVLYTYSSQSTGITLSGNSELIIGNSSSFNISDFRIYSDFNQDIINTISSQKPTNMLIGSDTQNDLTGSILKSFHISVDNSLNSGETITTIQNQIIPVTDLDEDIDTSTFHFQSKSDGFIGFNNFEDNLLLWYKFDKKHIYNTSTNFNLNDTIIGSNISLENGYLHSSSYKWNQNDTYIQFDADDIISQSNLSFNFWFNKNIIDSKDYIFHSINNTNTYIGFGIEGNAFFININNNEQQYSYNSTIWNHFNIEFTKNDENILELTRLQTVNTISENNLLGQNTFSSDVSNWNSSNLSIGYIGKDFGSHQLEDFRIYNKNLTIIEKTKQFQKLTTENKDSISINNIDTEIFYSFYKTPNEGTIIENLGKAGSLLNGLIKNSGLGITLQNNNNNNLRSTDLLNNRSYSYKWSSDTTNSKIRYESFITIPYDNFNKYILHNDRGDINISYNIKYTKSVFLIKNNILFIQHIYPDKLLVYYKNNEKLFQYNYNNQKTYFNILLSDDITLSYPYSSIITITNENTDRLALTNDDNEFNIGSDGLELFTFSVRVQNRSTEYVESSSTNIEYIVQTTNDIISRDETVKLTTGLYNPYSYNFNIKDDGITDVTDSFIKIDKSVELFQNIYTGFHFTILYWKKQNISDSTDFVLKTNNKDIIRIDTQNDYTKLSTNITNNSHELYLNTPITYNKWYLCVYTCGIVDQHLSLSIGLYDNTFIGISKSYLNSSKIIAFNKDEHYDININTNTTLEIGNSDIDIADIRIYNNFITQPDIYRILKNTSKPTIYNNTILHYNTHLCNYVNYNAIYNGDSNTSNIYGNETIVFNDTIQLINNNDFIHHFYDINLSTLYWKKSTNNNIITDFSIYNQEIDYSITNFFKFEFHGSDNDDSYIKSIIYNFNNSFETISSTNISLNKWYLLGFAMNYTNSITNIKLFIGNEDGNNLDIVSSTDNIVPFKNLFTPNHFVFGTNPTDNVNVLQYYIEDYKIYNSFIRNSTVQNIFDNSILAIDDEDKQDIQLWYRFHDFKEGVHTNQIKDLTGIQDAINSVTSNVIITQNTEHTNKFSKLQTNELAMKFHTIDNYIGVPYNILDKNKITILFKLKIKQIIGFEYTLFTYNNLSFHIIDNNIFIRINSEQKQFYIGNIHDNWISWGFVIYRKRKNIIIFKNGIKIGSYIFQNFINTNNNEFTIIDNRDKSLSEDEIYDVSIEDFRIYNKALNNTNIFKYFKA